MRSALAMRLSHSFEGHSCALTLLSESRDDTRRYEPLQMKDFVCMLSVAVSASAMKCAVHHEALPAPSVLELPALWTSICAR